MLLLFILLLNVVHIITKCCQCYYYSMLLLLLLNVADIITRCCQCYFYSMLSMLLLLDVVSVIAEWHVAEY